MSEPAPGSVFAGYRIDGVAGVGGMGVVYRAWELGLDRPVAVKVITPQLAEDVEFRERFVRESRLAASIDHPNVIPVYEASEFEGSLFLAMRWVEGTDLGALIKELGRFEPQRVAEIVAQVATALDAAHARGLVHRDVKPANVLLAAGDHAYLTDFGLTKRTSSESGLTSAGAFVGTVDYAAPEQVSESGAVDARADVYALGCVLYHALSGRVPFVRDSVAAKMFAQVNDEPPPVSTVAPGVSPALDQVVRRALAKDPSHRYPSAGDLGRAVLAAVEGGSLSEPERTVASGVARPAPGGRAGDATTPLHSVSRPEKRSRHRRSLLLAGLLLVLLALTTTLIGTLMSQEDDSDNERRPSTRTSEELSAGKASSDRRRVREVVHDFGRLEGARRCRLLATSLLDALGGLKACQSQLGRRAPRTLEAQNAKITRSTARVDAIVRSSGARFTFELVNESGDWRIQRISTRNSTS